MPANEFPRRGLLETLGSTAVRLQFHFLVLLHNFLVLPSCYGLSGTGTLACAQLFSARLKKFAVLPASSKASRLPACRSWTAWCWRSARAFFRREQCQQNIRFHARPEFHLRVVGDVHQQTIHLRAAHVLVRHFAAAVKNHGLHFVTVLGGRRAELHFLDV